MKIALASARIVDRDINYNLSQMERYMKEAKSVGTDLVCFFLYKNCVGHSDQWHDFADSSRVPCAYLKEHSGKREHNEGCGEDSLIENAMANVLCKYFLQT